MVARGDKLLQAACHLPFVLHCHCVCRTVIVFAAVIRTVDEWRSRNAWLVSSRVAWKREPCLIKVESTLLLVAKACIGLLQQVFNLL